MAATTTVPNASPWSRSRSFLSRLREGDEIARIITLLFAASVVLVTLLLVFELWRDSVLPRHKFGLNFFVTRVWDPIFDRFGALPFIYGTLVTAITALAIAVPLGIGAAIFLAELAPARLSDALEFFIDLLAAVPSVIYGVLGVFARAGITGSIFLALARALGETMAVTMVIGNTVTISASLLSPGYSIAAVIANEFTEATGDLYLQSLVELGLVLFLLTFLLNGLARLLIVVTSQRGSGMGHT